MEINREVEWEEGYRLKESEGLLGFYEVSAKCNINTQRSIHEIINVYYEIFVEKDRGK